MKTVFSYIMVLALGLTSAIAQSHDHGNHKKIRKEFTESLSEEQKTQFDFIKKLKKEQKETFRASYTEEQKAISQNEDLSRKEKREMTRETLTDEQNSMKASHREKMKAENKKFKATLNEEQLKQYKEMKAGKKNHKKLKKRE